MNRIIGLFFLLFISFIFCSNNTPSPKNNSTINQSEIVHDTVFIHNTIYNNEFCNDFLFDLTQLVGDGKMNEEYIQSVKRIFSVADIIIPGHGRVIDRSILEGLKKIVKSRS